MMMVTVDLLLILFLSDEKASLNILEYLTYNRPNVPQCLFYVAAATVELIFC